MVNASEEQNTEEDGPAEIDSPSKSQKKRDAQRAISLAKSLMGLPSRKRNRLNLSPEILEALATASVIKSNGARKRQMLFIGKLLRASENYDAIWQQYDQLEHTPAEKVTHTDKPRHDARQSHEAMRDRLLSDFAGSMDELRQSYPQANFQLIRQLASRIKKATDAGSMEIDETKPGKPSKSPSREKLMHALLKALHQGQSQGQQKD